MLFDDPACFRLDRIPVRPIHWLWRPYLACGNPALLDGDPGAGKSLLAADLAARGSRAGAGAGEAAPRRRRPENEEGRPGVLAMVQFDLAARRRLAPMRVRPTDPCHAQTRPYGLGRRPIRSVDGPSRGKTVGKIQSPTPLPLACFWPSGQIHCQLFAALVRRPSLPVGWRQASLGCFSSVFPSRGGEWKCFILLGASIALPAYRRPTAFADGPGRRKRDDCWRNGRLPGQLLRIQR
jgi:hypothetical protein